MDSNDEISPSSESSNFDQNTEKFNYLLKVLENIMKDINSQNFPMLDGNKQKIINDWIRLND